MVGTGVIETTVAAAEVSLAAYQWVSLLESETSSSALVTDLESKAGKQSILQSSGETAPVIPHKMFTYSPILESLSDLYRGKRIATCYVLYALPSAGKTTAARAFLKKMLRDTPKDVRPPALMVSGPVPEGVPYFQHMGECLGAGQSPWFKSLCAALKVDPRAEKRYRSILILDDFDAKGPNNANILFMVALCKRLYAERRRDPSFAFHVVIMTQKKDIANELCRANKWRKIVPMPGTYRVPHGHDEAGRYPDSLYDERNHPFINPDWTNFPWKKDQLVKLVKKAFPDDKFGEDDLGWIRDGYNPTSVLDHFGEVHERAILQSRSTAPSLNMVWNENGDEEEE
jgi:hypothetical protein